MAPFFVKKNDKADFGENNLIERFGECSFFTSKEPLKLSLKCRPDMYEVTN
jgi:hypothetical protein